MNKEISNFVVTLICAGVASFLAYRVFTSKKNNQDPNPNLTQDDIIVIFNEKYIFFKLNPNGNIKFLQNKTIFIKIIRNEDEPEEIMLSSDKPEAKVENIKDMDQSYSYKLQDGQWSPAKEITTVDYVQHLRGLKYIKREELLEVNKGLLEELKSYSKPLKILILGCSSYGKSSFIKTLWSAFDGRIHTLIGDNNVRSPTRKVTKYDCFGSIEIYDCPGIEESYKEFIFEDFLLGKIKPNVTVEQFIGLNEYPEIIADSAMWKPFDAIVLTIPLVFKQGENRRLERLHSFIQIAIKNNIRIILVFTKIDEAVSNRQITNQDILNEPAINQACKYNLENNMNAFKNSAYVLIKNLISNLDEPCPFRDWLALKVLKSIKDSNPI